MNDDLITATEAREILGVSSKKMAALTDEITGVLKVTKDPLDGRVRLVSRAAVMELLAQSSKKLGR